MGNCFDRSGSAVERISSLQGSTAQQPPSSSLPILQQQGNQQWQQRMTNMCDNHAMFQFLFDEQGLLLAANQRAMDNMRGKVGGWGMVSFLLHEIELCRV